MVVLDGIGKDIGLAFTVGLGVLLGTDHDGPGAVALVEEVDGGIELLQFPDLPGIDIEEILLQGTARRDAIDDDSGALVLQALDEETVEQFGGYLHDGDGAVGGGDEPELLILPILQQVFAEGIGADEDAHDGCHRVLLAKPFQRRDAVVVVVDDAAVTVHLELLRQFRGDLRQRLIRCEADAHGQSHGTPDALVQTLAPLLEIDALHAVEIIHIVWLQR